MHNCILSKELKLVFHPHIFPFILVIQSLLLLTFHILFGRPQILTHHTSFTLSLIQNMQLLLPVHGASVLIVWEFGVITITLILSMKARSALVTHPLPLYHQFHAVNSLDNRRKRTPGTTFCTNPSHLTVLMLHSL